MYLQRITQGSLLESNRKQALGSSAGKGLISRALESSDHSGVWRTELESSRSQDLDVQNYSKHHATGSQDATMTAAGHWGPPTE